MNHSWVATTSEYETILDAFGDDVILNVIRDIQLSNERDECVFAETCARVKKYVNEKRQHLLVMALSKDSGTYVRASPCRACKFNEPCVTCESTTPFDITLEKQKFVFTLCQGNERHYCIKCFNFNAIYVKN